MIPPDADDTAEDARFSAAFRSECGAAPVPFARFMELALYHPQLGYYRRPRPRVGLATDTDFYTATSTGEVFGELVAAAATKLLGAEAADHDFVELGSENGRTALDGVAHPFRSVRAVGCTDAAALGGPCVVFSNELFDAQPFHRVVRSHDGWREIGVTLADDTLVEAELATLSPEVATVVPLLPTDLPAGYRMDLPLAAAALCRQLVAAAWTGLFLAFDYGKTWSALATDTPTGTARAYHAHRQERDLLKRPGRQDLTCHICWDWLESALRAGDFGSLVLESQESFLVRHAGAAAARIAAEAKPGRPDPRRSRLHELLHPGLLGQRFQVLHARR